MGRRRTPARKVAAAAAGRRTPVEELPLWQEERCPGEGRRRGSPRSGINKLSPASGNPYTPGPRRIERAHIRSVERRARFPPLLQVRIRANRLTGDDEVRLARGEIALGALEVVAAREEQMRVGLAAQHRADRLGDGRCAHRGVVHEVDVQQAPLVELPRQVGVVGLHLRVQGHVVEHAERGDADANLLLADGLDGPRRRPRVRIVRGPRSSRRGDPCVGSSWGAGTARGDSRSHCALRCRRSRRRRRACADNTYSSRCLFQVGFGHGLRHRQWLHALLVGPHFPGRRYGCGGQHAPALRQVECMGDTPAVHELHEHLRTFLMHGLGDEFPALDLLGGEYSGDTRITQAIRRGRCAFGDDESERSALGVVLRHQFVRDVSNRAAASQRRHDQVILQGQRSNYGLRE